MEIKSTHMKDIVAIPDILSLLNMSFGIFAIISAINNHFDLSSIFIIVALIFDSLDGHVARKLKREDKYGFGKNIDSLSDIVSFGVAPSVFLYTIGNTIPNSPSILILIVSLLITICGVLRLSRYNILSGYVSNKEFIGLPIPGIAILLSLFYLSDLFNIYLVLISMILSSFLMISNVKYEKIQDLKIIPFAFILIILTIIIFYTSYINIPGIILLLLVICYLLISLFKNY